MDTINLRIKKIGNPLKQKNYQKEKYFFIIWTGLFGIQITSIGETITGHNKI